MEARMQGKVLVTKKESFGQGDRKFVFTEAKVQTGVATIVAVRFTDQWSDQFEIPRAGDWVDLDVVVSGFSGRNSLTLSATAEAPHDDTWELQNNPAYLAAA